ncbi:hypothetical protein ACFW1M_22320 [Streptomyces inhibens]|uniref:hypothetical protein n=1 Tax=Streptomyces inhibens TaxID=2293571 RepID=UPI0036C3E970
MPDRKSIPAARPTQKSAREKALGCPICAESTPLDDLAGGDEVEGETDGFGPVPRGWSPPPNYRTYADDLLSYLEDARAGETPESRLLAAACVLRVRPSGDFRLAAYDLDKHRLALPFCALESLVDSGWLVASLAEVKATEQDGQVPRCHIPDLAESPLLMGVPSSVRPRFNGWMQRMVTHPMLVGQPAGVRLSAFYVTSQCDTAGEGLISTRDMTALCCLSSRALASPVLMHLLKLGWLTRVDPSTRPGRPVRILASRTILKLIPGAAPGPAPRPTPLIVQGWGFEIAQWVDAYVARHHHGPRLRELFRAHFVENPAAGWTDPQMQTAVRDLATQGWLHIEGSRWYRIRPGNKYQRRLAQRQNALQQPSARRNTAQPSREVPTPAPSYPSSLDERPAEQGRPTGVTRIAAPTASSSSRTLQPEPATQALPKGLWAIPGAEVVLGARPQEI